MVVVQNVLVYDSGIQSNSHSLVSGFLVGRYVVSARACVCVCVYANTSGAV